MRLNVKFFENEKKLKISFQEMQKKFCVSFSDIQKKFKVSFGEVFPITEYIGGELYNGDYVVTPKIIEQSLPTKDNILIDDVKIKEIPFYKVVNQSGGNTIYIGDKI